MWGGVRQLHTTCTHTRTKQAHCLQPHPQGGVGGKELGDAAGQLGCNRAAVASCRRIPPAADAAVGAQRGKRAAAAARDVGALVLGDGAQAAGAAPVDPVALGVHAYAFPAQKWLLGPEGLGALWVDPAAMGRIAPVFSGYETGTDHGWDGSVVMHPDARRFEASTEPEILLAGWTASLEWLAGLGWPRVHAATAGAAARCRAALDALPGVVLDAPLMAGSGLVAFRVPGVASDVAAMQLADAGVIVRPLPEPGGLRASCGFFTDDDDIRRLTEVLAALAPC